MKKKKLILSSVFFILIIGITFYTIFSKNSINDIISNINKINFSSIIICIFLMILYFVIQGIYMKYILKSLDYNSSLIKCIYYSIVEFFFSGITPSSTGGQPVQLYYMSKDKVPVEKSLITLLLGTIFFKLFLLFFAVIIFIYDSSLVFASGKLFIFCFFLGLITDSFIVIACLLSMYDKKFIKMTVKFLYSFKKLSKEEKELRIKNKVQEYSKEVDYVKKHIKETVISLILTFIQRILLFSISYVLFKSFGLSGYSYFDLIIVFITVQICIEAMPLPGGTGISEKLINTLYLTIFGETLASTGMILTRCFSFYIPLIICMFIIIIVTKKYYIDK